MLYFAEDVLTFVGNITHSDHFKLLREDGSSLLIGARNVVYNLTLADLTENLNAFGGVGVEYMTGDLMPVFGLSLSFN